MPPTIAPIDLQQFLHRHVPLSQAMQVCVEAINADQLVLAAPFAPNLNQHGTVFGGSAATLGVLASWSLLHTRLMQQAVHCKLVVQRSAMDYEAPMSAAFTATATLADPADWAHFIATFEAHGKSRIQVRAVLRSEGRRAGVFSGEFVALRESAGEGAA